MFERFSRRKTEKKDEAADPSRRAFLGRSAKALAGAGAFALTSHLEQISAFATALKEGASFPHGAETLVREVFENEKEVLAICSIKKDGKGAWYNVTEGTKYGVGATPESTIRTFARLLKEKGVEAIGEIHTHPLADEDEDTEHATVNLSEREIQEMREGKRPLLAQIPSPSDVWRHQTWAYFLQQKYNLDSKRFFSATFDTSGVWYLYTIPGITEDMYLQRKIVERMQTLLRLNAGLISEHDVDALYAKLQERDPDISWNWLPSLTEDNARLPDTATEEERKRATILAYLQNGDPDAIEAVLTDAHDKTIQKNGRALELALHATREKIGTAMKEYAAKSLRGSLSAEDYAALTEIYAEAGVRLHFESYQTLGLSYKDLHRR